MKKERPFYQIPKLHDLTRCITELTEELEELKTEKAMLLRSLDCADDVGISAVKKEIAALESALQKLSEQEEKYDPMMMQDSKRDVANLLNEETEARSIRERLRQKQQAQQKQNKKKSRDRWER